MLTLIVGSVMAILTWAGNKALPIVFQARQTRYAEQVRLAQDLCQNHKDCEAQKALAMKGIKVKK